VESKPQDESITVINKVYPEWGERNGWIVCVGGINQNNEWRRLYPIPLDIFTDPKKKHLKFKKWDRIELEIRKRPLNKDPRKESYEPLDISKMKILDHIGTANGGWEKRREIIDKFLSPGMKALNDKRYEDHSRGQWASMGVIKPLKILDFLETDRASVPNDEEGEAAKQVMGVQMRSLVGTGPPPMTPDPINKKIGFKFKCGESECVTDNNHGHYIMCTDWEVNELYRRVGFAKTREKMMWAAQKRDLYLCMGTVAKKWPTFINVGIFYPPPLDD
jgi:hypothetical protein